MAREETGATPAPTSRISPSVLVSPKISLPRRTIVSVSSVRVFSCAGPRRRAELPRRWLQNHPAILPRILSHSSATLPFLPTFACWCSFITSTYTLHRRMYCDLYGCRRALFGFDLCSATSSALNLSKSFLPAGRVPHSKVLYDVITRMQYRHPPFAAFPAADFISA